MTTNNITRTLADVPCGRCTDPRGDDLRRSIAQTDGIINEAQTSPISGLPLGCCRIRSSVILMQQRD